jgi:hypothetical protein
MDLLEDKKMNEQLNKSNDMRMGRMDEFMGC